MIVSTVHESFSERCIIKAGRWVRDQIGMTVGTFREVRVEVGYRKRSRRNGGDGWGGYYHPQQVGRLIQVLIGREVRYPTPMWHNQEEKAAGYEAHDEWELFISILAHEMEHARAFAVARTGEERRRLNHEPRVRAVDRRVMLAFRANREALLAEWMQPAAERPSRPAKPQPTPVERRAARAAELLASWERKLRLAKTKVCKYRRKVGYYQRAASKKGGAA